MMRILLTTGLALSLCAPLTAAVDPQLDNNAMVTEHNAVRASVSAGTWHSQPAPVTALGGFAFSAALATAAQGVSDTCTYAHSGTPGVGENLYASGSSLSPPIIWTESAVVQTSWSGEAVDYTYASNTCAAPPAQCGHYTQVAWAFPTPTVGCGATQCNTGSPWAPAITNWVFVVCQYSPPGNVVGQRPYCAAG